MGKKVLVADDSVTIQKVIKLALSSEGYDILAVSEGKEAVRAISEECPDVVLIDVALPGADAFEVKKAISGDPRLANAAFVLMASAFEKVDEDAVEQAGFRGRLIKPFDPANLRKVVSDMIKQAQKPTAAAVAADTKSEIDLPPPPVEFPPPRQGLGLPDRLHDLDLTPVDADDLPPLQDLQPTINEPQAAPPLAENDFDLNISADAVPVAAPDISEEEAADAERALENDIKNLTESTIKMSGLDDFQWSLDDSRKMKAPPVPGSAKTATPPSLHLQTEVKAQEEAADLTRPIERDRVTPLRPTIPVPKQVLDDGGSNFPLKGASAHQPQKPKEVAPKETIIEPTPTIELSVPMPGIAGKSAGAGATSLPITRAEIEELIRKDLEVALEKLARETVPMIAEKIIRKEIEKILAEP